MVFLEFKFKPNWSKAIRQTLVSVILWDTGYLLRQIPKGFFKINRETKKLDFVSVLNNAGTPYIEFDEVTLRIRKMTNLPDEEQNKIQKRVSDFFQSAEEFVEKEALNVFDDYESKAQQEFDKQNSKCIICEGAIDKHYDKDGKMYWDKGHNALPIANGRCCDDCNNNKVIPARMRLNKASEKEAVSIYGIDDIEGDEELFFQKFGIQPIDRLKNFQLVKKYWEAKMEGLSEDDFINQDMDLLKAYWKTSYKASMDEAKIFAIEDDVVPLLLHTDCSDGKFPFNSVFIDCKVQIKNRTYFGFHIGSYYTEATQYKAILTAYAKKVEHNGKMMTIIVPDFILLAQSNLNSDLPFKKSDFYHKKVRSFAFAFCNFINEPEVSIIEQPLNPKNNIRRIERGVMPLPAYKNVVIRGNLRIYVDRMKREWQGGTHAPCGYRYWVRGFYRHFFDKKRYAKLYALDDNAREKAGLTMCDKHEGVLRLWVKPFIRGQGILIKQSWEVTE